MKKIRFVDQTEMEIYNITQHGNSLHIDILNGDANVAEQTFKNVTNLATIQYYVGTEILKGYAGFSNLTGYEKRMGQTISIDYGVPDTETESGFAEIKADVLTVMLDKPAKIEAVADQTEQNTADIDYIAMEPGVSV